MLFIKSPTHNLFFLFLILGVLGPTTIAHGQEAEEATEDVHSTIHPDDEASFPLLQFGGNLNVFSRQENVGGFLSLDLAVDADWFLGGARVAGGAIGYASNDWLFTEFSGYAHLLAIGVSDITYRYYLDGHEFRMFGGFSYTEHVEDIVRVDVNLGLAYFNEADDMTSLDQVGFQLGTRISANFWRIRNILYLAAYQNVKFNDGPVDLSGTEIVCDTSGVLAGEDLICEIVEPEDDGEGGSSGLLDWQTTGVILQNRTFINFHNEEETEWGLELEFRVEITPLRGTNIWAMAGFRGQWETD